MPSTKSSRRRARELVLQGAYQRLLSGNEPAAIAAQLREVAGFDKADGALFERLWRGVNAHFDELMAAIAPYLDRAHDALSPIERCVLAIAAWELLHEPATPYRVIINEAVELAKAYGGTDGYKYVNGVLDKLASSAREHEERGRASP